MQFIKVNKRTTLSQLSDIVGTRNVESILNLNDTPRVPQVGAAFLEVTRNKIADAKEVTPDRKSAIINTLTTDSDVFETAALTSASGWKLLDSANTLPNMMRVPDSIHIPDSTELLGNNIPVRSEIYQKVITGIEKAPHTIDPTIFNEYSAIRSANILDFVSTDAANSDPMQWFRVPWGEVTLHSSLSDESIQFPVYPEEVSDSAKANYTTMPDLLYQYEPWQIYNSSGPRTQTYTFDFHRDMWTGDHRDGRANDLIRACMANCYPEYRGSAVYTSIVTLYIAGSAVIRGVLTDVNVNWDGPLGLDGWYLHCKLDLTITEVSKKPLDYETVRKKPLIG